MELEKYEFELLDMMEKFGPAISSSAVEKRETALQDLVKAGYSTMIRNSKGQILYSVTREGILYLEEHRPKDKDKK